MWPFLAAMVAIFGSAAVLRAAGCLGILLQIIFSVTFCVLSENYDNPQTNVTNQSTALIKPRVSSDPKPQPGPRGVPTALTRSTVQEIQRFLRQLGYDAGHIDGVWGKKTLSALRKFEDDFQYTRHSEHETDQIIFILRSEYNKMMERKKYEASKDIKQQRLANQSVDRNSTNQGIDQRNSAQNPPSSWSAEDRFADEMWLGEWRGEGKQDTWQVWSIVIIVHKAYPSPSGGTKCGDGGGLAA